MGGGRYEVVGHCSAGQAFKIDLVREPANQIVHDSGEIADRVPK